MGVNAELLLGLGLGDGHFDRGTLILTLYSTVALLLEAFGKIKSASRPIGEAIYYAHNRRMEACRFLPRIYYGPKAWKWNLFQFLVP